MEAGPPRGGIGIGSGGLEMRVSLGRGGPGTPSRGRAYAYMGLAQAGAGWRLALLQARGGASQRSQSARAHSPAGEPSSPQAGRRYSMPSKLGGGRWRRGGPGLQRQGRQSAAGSGGQAGRPVERDPYQSLVRVITGGLDAAKWGRTS